MTKNFCDKCGSPYEKAENHGTWGISLTLDSGFGTNTKVIELCGKCGVQAANALGFCYDTGFVLSIAQGQQVGTVGGSVFVETKNPDEPIAGAMK